MSQSPLLLRRRDAAELLAVSETQILKWERDGLLRPISLQQQPVGGIRAIRYAADEVRALAEKWIREGRQESACA